MSAVPVDQKEAEHLLAEAPTLMDRIIKTCGLDNHKVIAASADATEKFQLMD